MKATQAYTFIRNRKDITMSKDVFSNFIDTKDKTLHTEIANLPNFNVSDASVNKYVEVLTKAISKSDQKRTNTIT